MEHEGPLQSRDGLKKKSEAVKNPSWNGQVQAGRQNCSDPVQPQDVIVGELSENIDRVHNVSNKAKRIVQDACISLVL